MQRRVHGGSTASIFHLITSKKANQASKCPQSAKKRTVLFKKKWLRKQSLKRLRPPRRLQLRRQKRKRKNNVFKKQKTTNQNLQNTPCYNLLYNKKPDTQENNTMAEFILKNLFSILYKHVQI